MTDTSKPVWLSDRQAGARVPPSHKRHVRENKGLVRRATLPRIHTHTTQQMTLMFCSHTFHVRLCNLHSCHRLVITRVHWICPSSPPPHRRCWTRYWKGRAETSRDSGPPSPKPSKLRWASHLNVEESLRLFDSLAVINGGLVRALRTVGPFPHSCPVISSRAVDLVPHPHSSLPQVTWVYSPLTTLQPA